MLQIYYELSSKIAELRCAALKLLWLNYPAVLSIIRSKDFSCPKSLYDRHVRTPTSVPILELRKMVNWL